VSLCPGSISSKYENDYNQLKVMIAFSLSMCKGKKDYLISKLARWLFKMIGAIRRI
jgi:hypothetical protein